MINSNSADRLKSKPMPKSTEVKGKSPRKNIPPIDDVRNATYSVVHSTYVEDEILKNNDKIRTEVENEILKNNDKIRTEIEDKIKSVKQEIRDDKILFLNTTKWVIGIISGIIISVISLFYYLYMPDIKLIPVHEDRIKNLKEDINNLEKNFEKFFKNKKF